MNKHVHGHITYYGSIAGKSGLGIGRSIFTRKHNCNERVKSTAIAVGAAVVAAVVVASSLS